MSPASGIDVLGRLRTQASAVLALGVPSVLAVARYRLGVKWGLHPARRLQASAPEGPFYKPVGPRPVPAPVVSAWRSSGLLFSWVPVPLTSRPPDWLANAITGERIAAPERPWWQIPDFDPAVGDIKLVWELSRLDWVPAFAQQARAGDPDALMRLNDWLADWCRCNPSYRGPNWKCGQEASLRVMNLAVAALILGQTRAPADGLRELIRLHLQRIAPTVHYAMAQDNNHGTSEAATLFIGGSWLSMLGVAEGKAWQQKGRFWLEDRAARLVGQHGSFSQYSLNYHRLMLDTFCLAEAWRRHLGLEEFSSRWSERALAAAQWLRHMINPVNGDGPNVGANDGARLLPLSDAPYRDYRSTVQLAMALFAGERAYAAEGAWNHALAWLGVPLPSADAPVPGNYMADDGGFAVLRRGKAMALLRYPRFRFRPSHADALHVDLWHGADNLLRDGGTYGYNTGPEWLEYFGGTASHNTVQFDGRDQMPRLGRFLFGDWLRTSDLEPTTEEAQATRFGAGYRDRHGAGHYRRIALSDGSLRVEDRLSGRFGKAVLRWRLAPGPWRLEGTRLANGAHRLEVQADMPIVRCELVEGWESRHYLEKTPLPVLEVEVERSGAIVTEYHWAA